MCINSPLILYLKFAYPSLETVNIKNHFNENIFQSFGWILDNLLYLIVVLTALPLFLFVCRYFLRMLAQFFENLSNKERLYLFVSTVTLLIILLEVSSNTSFFVYPVSYETYLSEDCDGIHYKYLGNGDHFMNSDTGLFLSYQYYRYGGDCFRHPYFTKVMFPFFALFDVLSAFYHIFYSSCAYSYALSISTTQIVLYVLSGALLGRLFKFAVFSEILQMIYIASFPFVFVLCPERLIFSSFFLILAIYITFTSSDFIKNLIPMIAAIGTTSLSLFPIAFAQFLNKKILYIIFILFPIGVLLLIFTDIRSSLGSENEKNYTNQYINYCRLMDSCYFVPKWETYENNNEILTLEDGSKVQRAPNLFIRTNENQYVKGLISGITIFLLCITGGLLFIREKIVMTSLFWFAVSFGIVGVIGFGSQECVLFCSYFSWAVIPLSLLPFYWLWQKFPRLPIPQALYIFAAYLAISNLYFIYQVVQIVSERYIVPPGM